MSNFPLHERHSIRLKETDYTGAGGYFLTFVAHDKACLFGAISGEQVILNPFGKIVEEEWLHTPAVRPEIILDEYVIMPNHLHGIVFITETTGAHTPEERAHAPEERGQGRAPLRSHSQSNQGVLLCHVSSLS